MATSYGALCSDFYVNTKLAVKMDMPSERETVLHFFDRVSKSLPTMNRFRRYDGELALESSRAEQEYRWLALRQHGLRTGHVNPESLDASAEFHKLMLEIAPFHLTLSALDVDYLEVLFGFDLECEQDHDDVVFDALLADSPLGNLAKLGNGETIAKVLDVQPVFGLSLSEGGETQAYYEIKTRPRSRRGKSSRNGEPISLFLTVRRYGPIDSLESLTGWYSELASICDTLCSERLVPDLLNPINRVIAAT